MALVGSGPLLPQAWLELGGSVYVGHRPAPAPTLLWGRVLASEQPESRNLWKTGTEWPREKLAFIFQPQFPLPGLKAKLYGR